jgi:hypothetical protein
MFACPCARARKAFLLFVLVYIQKRVKGGFLFLGKIEFCTATSKIGTLQATVIDSETETIIMVFPNPTKNNATVASLSKNKS